VSFVSPTFYVFLAVVGAAFYLIPGRLRAGFLLLASYAFYAYASPLYLVLLLAATAATYGLGLAIARSPSDKTKSTFVSVGVIGLVAMIVAFKLAGVLKGLFLPLGISYYSFKLLSYLIEVYWDEDTVERDPVLFFLYPSFFPQMVSGPIQRPGSFLEQMRDAVAKRANVDQIEEGIEYILTGLMLKLLIGDRISAIINKVDAAHAQFSYGTMLVTVACYTLQLYADFSGYTRIALGIGRVFGIVGPENFDRPFLAVNIQEMWRRWHMSLTSWVTDYLFTPLNMLLRAYGQAGLMGAIALNMVVIGLWHGLTVNFLVFGLLHAAFIIGTIYARRVLPAGKGGAGKAMAIGGMILTFVLMSFSQIFWRSPTWDRAMSILRQVAGLTASGSKTLADVSPSAWLEILVCGAISLAAGCGVFNTLGRKIDGFAPRWLQFGLWMFLLIVLWPENAGSFVYGQF
jgi:alginate O-acetyltransferase complex protein AlgI